MKKIVNTILAGVLGLTIIAGAAAQSEPPAEIEVQYVEDGDFTAVITVAPDFGEVDYSLTDRNDVSGTNLVIRVTDARGGANGWNVTLSGGPFTSTTTEHTFAVSNMTLGTGASAVVGSVGDANQVNATSGNGMVVSDSDQKIIAAAQNHGSNGVFDITFTGNLLDVPGGTLVGNYTSTLEVGLNTGP